MKNDMSFRGQKKGEQLVKVYFKHWISFVRPVLVFLPFLLVSMTILYYQALLGTLILSLGFLIFLVGLSYLTYHFLIWRWDVYILTNYRVINFDQRTLFHRVVSEAELVNVQDTTYEVKGIWQTIFNYGQVNILTASSGENICFRDVANPQMVQALIVSVKDKKDQTKD
ncbi:MAG TPA: PH domain-containing protein [bacterium]|nr:PH domain-containing protein [bacterium]HPN67717.1 PH domain-containing protein [bacterium]